MLTLPDTAKKIVDCLGVCEGEKFLVLYDSNYRDIANEILEAAFSITKNVRKFKEPVGCVNGEEPPADAAAAILESDSCVFITTVSHSHTKARRDATDSGVRIASIPGASEEILRRAMDTDFLEMRSRTLRLKEILDSGEMVRITTEKGTDLSFSIKGRSCLKPGGILCEKGDFGNLPSGEACLAPVEGTANGTFVIDASILKEMVDSDITVNVKEGYAVSIEGCETAKKLKEALEKVGKDAFNIAELGIGTNPAAKVTGNTLEDEKVMGTAHLAFGNSISFGGKVDVPIHLDGVFYEPSIEVDGRVIIEKGEFKF